MGPLERLRACYDRQLGKVGATGLDWLGLGSASGSLSAATLGPVDGNLGRRGPNLGRGLVFELVSHLSSLGDPKHLLPCATLNAPPAFAVLPSIHRFRASCTLCLIECLPPFFSLV